MKNLVQLVVCFLFFAHTFSLHAQVTKKTLLISPFTSGDMVDPALADQVSQYTYSAAVQSKRVEVIDPNATGSEGFDARISQSDYLMEGSILGVEIKEKSRTNEETGEVTTTYEAYVNFTVKITNPSNGQIIASEQMRIGNDILAGGGVNSLMNSPKTPEAAMNKAMKAVNNKIKKFINKHFKLEAELVEITENKGPAAKMVLISGGSAAGFKKNTKLTVSMRSPKTLSNGTTLMRTKQIGQIKVSKVEDENFSICQVTKGGEAIKKAMAEGTVLICLTIK